MNPAPYENGLCGKTIQTTNLVDAEEDHAHAKGAQRSDPHELGSCPVRGQGVAGW